MVGNAGEGDSLSAVSPALQEHQKQVIEPAMKNARPARNWRPEQFQLRAKLMVELMKNNMNGNRICIQCVDSRRIAQIEFQSTNSRIPPALDLIGQEPPKIGKKMGPTNAGDFVPENARGGNA